MAPDATTHAGHISRTDSFFSRVLGATSIFTLLMTVPQVLTVWVSRQTAGVSIISWSAYLFSALLWFAYGLHKRDRNIYLPCVGWVGLDAAVIAGVLVYS